MEVVSGQDRRQDYTREAWVVDHGYSIAPTGTPQLHKIQARYEGGYAGGSGIKMPEEPEEHRPIQGESVRVSYYGVLDLLHHISHKVLQRQKQKKTVDN